MPSPEYDPNWVSPFEPDAYIAPGNSSGLGRGLRQVARFEIPFENPGLSTQSQPPASWQDSSTNTDPSLGNIFNSWRQFQANPRAVKENIAAEHMARMGEEYGSYKPPADDLNNSALVFQNILNEGKRQEFAPGGSWRRVSDENLASGGTAQQEAAMFFDEKATQLGGSNLKQQALNKLRGYVEQFKPGNVRDYVPGFIANPLALRNPLVSSDSPIAQGAQFNPELVDWMSKQTGSPFDKGLDALGGKVSASSYYPNKKGPRFSLSFEGPTGYTRPRELRKRLQQVEQQRAAGRHVPFSQTDFEETNNLLNRVEENPHASDAIKYQLGRVIEQIPTGSTITAAPIGGSGSARDVLYKRISKGALETGKPFRPNLDQYPTEEEFRSAASGGGSTLHEMNADANIIRSIKTGPTQFKTVTGKDVTWDPSTLKDPMIRSAFNIDPSTDVSGLRDNPMSAFLNKGSIDFSRPVITTDSPVYKLRQGIKGGAGLAATNLIPSPEAIQSFYAGDTAGGVKRMAGDVASGIPMAAAAGGIEALAPALSPVIGAAGPAFAAVAAARALNEVSRQQSGEGLVPKFRQFIGTAPRTGMASASAPTRPYVQPRLTKTQPVNPVVREVQNRFGLAGARFNPAKGEFGLSELFFGR